MAFNWNDYLDLAKSFQKLTLSKIKIEEACCRTAVSRAYYAVYHIALDFAEKNLSYSKSTGIEAGKNHSELGKYYKGCADYEYKKLGRILRRMHSDRLKCDYGGSIGNAKSTMNNTILNADDIIKIINKKSI